MVAAPDDLDARARMLEGAVLGGRCLQNASMGVHHGLSQLLGGRTNIPHGLANAIVLPHAIRFNAEAVPDAIERIAAAAGSDGEGLADSLAALAAGLGLPSSRYDVGVTDEDIQAVSRLSQSNPAVRANPRPVSEADALVILEDAF